ncbi:MAG: hypothetical protein WCO19_01935 [Candidatus Saccharibacteria bacterium]
MIAALFVARDGCYFDVPDVDPWDQARDARFYADCCPVVAHPPCERWGRYWYGSPMLHALGRRKVLGDDDGCFASALASVRRCGGVLEHPQASHAWRVHGITAPPFRGGWVVADDVGGWTCCVEQGHYGHRARKATWLYAVGCDLPSLVWGPSAAGIRMDPGFHSKEERRAAIRLGTIARMPRKERSATPLPFRDVLLTMARSVRATA